MAKVLGAKSERRMPFVAAVCLALPVLAAAAFSPPAVAQTDRLVNLLLNPGFELGLQGWTTSAGTATYTADGTTECSGHSSAKGVEANRGSLGKLFQDVTLLAKPGLMFRIGGCLKTEGVQAGGGLVIGLNYANVDDATPASGHIKTVGFLAGTSDWTPYESEPFVVPAMPVDAVALHFAVDFSDASGTGWADDLFLEPVLPI